MFDFLLCLISQRVFPSERLSRKRTCSPVIISTANVGSISAGKLLSMRLFLTLLPISNANPLLFHLLVFWVFGFLVTNLMFFLP